MEKYKLIPKITLWALMAIGIVVTVMFFFLGGSEGTLEVAGDFLNIPYYTDLMLNWNYILFALVCLATLCAVVAKFIGMLRVDVKKALGTLGVVIAFVLLVVLCWVMGSPEEVKIIGYEGSDNVGTMAQLADACMYLTYILFACTLLTMIGGVIYTKTLK